MQKITPCLWFDMNCEEAIQFYVSAFPNSSVRSLKRYPEGVTDGPMKGMAGKILTGIFTLDGYEFQALDGGPYFKMNSSVSFMLNFDPSREQDAEGRLNALWEKLAEGGEVRMPLQEYGFSKRYGWIQDRFGVNWQLILTNPAGEPRPAIMPSLMFTKDVSGKAEEAAQYYASLFSDARVGTVVKYPSGTPGGVDGGVMFEEFMLAGQWFTAMDAGPMHDFRFNEAISFSITCADQAEVDFFWEKLSVVPESEQCGWVKDRYGLSWQIIPKRLGELLEDPDAGRANRTLQAMLSMKKIDIAALEAAANAA